MTWDGCVRLAFDELRLAGAGSPQGTRRMRAALEDLDAAAPPEHRPRSGASSSWWRPRRAFRDEADVRAALVPDMQGIGSGPDVMSPGESAGGREPLATDCGTTQRQAAASSRAPS